MQDTDSATLGKNFKKHSKADKFSSTPDLLSGFLPSLQLPSHLEQGRHVSEGSNTRDRFELVQTTVVHS